MPKWENGRIARTNAAELGVSQSLHSNRVYIASEHMQIWKVLKHDEQNTKALFRRGMAHRKLNLYELSRADLVKAKQILNNKSDAAIERELKLLEKDEKSADKAFYAKMKKQMKMAEKQKQKKREQRRKQKEEEEKVDNNPNLSKNIKNNNEDDGDDEQFRWDIPEDTNDENSANINDKSIEQPSEF